MDASSHPRTLASGRYQLEEPIGRGAMAVVYRAHDTRLGVDRAVKMLTAEPEAALGVAQRMQAEARAMSRLDHPHIVRLHDIGREHGLDYIVMDLAESSLQQRLETRGAIPSHQVVHWMVQVLSALAWAHGEGVVHRDIKPHNILLDRNGHALLSDFGIALLTDLRQTQTGATLGSLAYMPPEQRLDAAKVDHRADLYAAGACTFALLTGNNPADLFLADADSPRWAKLHPGMAAVLRTACAREPEDRFQSAGTFIEALAQVHPVDTPRWLPLPSGAFRALRKGHHGDGDTLLPAQPARSRPWRSGGVLLAGAIAIGAALGSLQSSPTPPPAAPTQAVVVAAPAPVPVLWTGPVQPEAPPEEPPRATTQGRPGPAALHHRATEPHEGVWRTVQNGVEVSVEVHGPPESLRGKVESRLGKKVHVARVTGRYDQRARQLRLAESDTSTRYELRLSQDASRVEGSVLQPGSTRSLSLLRGP